jgi:hypothetical protein
LIIFGFDFLACGVPARTFLSGGTRNGREATKESIYSKIINQKYTVYEVLSLVQFMQTKVLMIELWGRYWNFQGERLKITVKFSADAEIINSLTALKY